MTMAGEPRIGPAAKPNEDIVIEDISRKRFEGLTKILRSSRSQDAYVRSPLYFAFTGRKGLLYLHSKDVELIACAHPNDDCTLLLFVPFVYDERSFRSCINAIVRNLKNGQQSELFKIFRLFDSVHIARVPKSVIGVTEPEGYSIVNGCQIQREKKLDWTYPSYDVLLSRSADPIGLCLARYRNKLNKYNDRGVTAVPFAEVPEEDRFGAMRSIAERWAKHKLEKRGSGSSLSFYKDELLEPYEYLADLTQNPAFSIDGIFLKRGSEYIAFRLWENSGDYDHAVPSFAALMAYREPGCSEYLHYESARRLLACGYQEMCIGGSESAALDSFKQKFQPIRGHELFTLNLNVTAIASSRPVLHRCLGHSVGRTKNVEHRVEC
jgi:hypothetical protein